MNWGEHYNLKINVAKEKGKWQGENTKQLSKIPYMATSQREGELVHQSILQIIHSNHSLNLSLSKTRYAHFYFTPPRHCPPPPNLSLSHFSYFLYLVILSGSSSWCCCSVLSQITIHIRLVVCVSISQLHCFCMVGCHLLLVCFHALQIFFPLFSFKDFTSLFFIFPSFIFLLLYQK